MISFSKAITLLEILIALVLLSIIALGIGSIEIFSRYQALSSDRLAKVQNELSFCLEHISKNALRTIGNEVVFGSDTAVYIPASNIIRFYIDGNSNGKRDSADYWIEYNFSVSNFRLTYCSRCNNSSCSSCPGGRSILSNKITSFSAVKNLSSIITQFFCRIG